MYAPRWQDVKAEWCVGLTAQSNTSPVLSRATPLTKSTSKRKIASWMERRWDQVSTRKYATFRLSFVHPVKHFALIPSAGSHHIRSSQFRDLTSGWQKGEESASKGSHDPGAALECGQGHPAVWWVALSHVYQLLTLSSKLSSHKQWNQTTATNWQHFVFFRSHSSFQPGHGSRVYLPYLWTGRRATICIHCGKEAGEPGASLTY